MMQFACPSCQRVIKRKHAGEGRCRCGVRYIIYPGPSVRFLPEVLTGSGCEPHVGSFESVGEPTESGDFKIQEVRYVPPR